jgi:uncharacterized protein involved in exopolysaccharide biosynthesis
MAQPNKEKLDLASPLPPLYAPEEHSRFLEPFIILAKHKFLIFFTVMGVGVLTAIISLLLPIEYTATAKILPPQQSQSFSTALLGQLGPLITATAGKDLGLHNPNDMYIAMLRSRTLEDALVKRFSLMGIYKARFPEDASRALESHTEITSGKDMLITVSVTDHDANRAAEIANGYIEELEKLTHVLAVTDAGKRRIFFEQEVKTASEELANAEQALKQTQEKTGILQLDSQSRVMLEAFADLRAQVASKEVQIQAMRSYATPENPDLLRAEQELAALRTQMSRFEQGQGGQSMAEIALAKVPSAGLEYVRRLREVKYREALFELLAKEYEAARIDAGKNSSLIQTLDKAQPPARRSWPRRTSLVLTATFAALLFGIVAAFVVEKIQRLKEDPQFQLFKFYLLGRNRA